ncbi:MAG: GRP family sugar transporter [Halobacteria archaeon]
MDPHLLLYLSALFFGSMFVPRKFARRLAGPGYALTMAFGIVAVAGPLALAAELRPPAGAASLALLSGLLWAAGNLLFVEAILRIGISRAFLIFSVTSVNQFLAGVLLLGEGSVTGARVAGVLLVTAGSVVTARSGAGGGDGTGPEGAASRERSRDVRNGALFAAASTLFFGLFYVPLARALPETGGSGGIALLGAAGLFPPLLLLAARSRMGEWVRAGGRDHSAALASGSLFALGQVLAVSAIGVVGLSVGAPVINGGLVLVSTLWGTLVFREVGPGRARLRVAAACALVVLGVALIA